MKKQPFTSETGISYTYNSDNNIDKLKSVHDNNEPTNSTIEEFEIKKERIKQNNYFLKETFINFGEIYKNQL